MRRKWLAGILFAVLMLCLSGCGVNEKTDKKTEKKIRQKSVNEEEFLRAYMQPGGVLTSNCIYVRDETGEYIVQWSHEGKELSREEFECDEYDMGYGLEAGSDRRLILSQYQNKKGVGEQQVLYNVPIRQTDNGETVQWNQKEEVAVAEITERVVLCEPYLIYMECIEEKYTLIRLDLETKEKKKLDFLGLEDVDFYPAAVADGLLYLFDREAVTGRGGIVYRIHIDDWTSEKVYEGTGSMEEIYGLSIDGDYLWMSIDTYEDGDGDGVSIYSYCRIECYDMKQKKTVAVLSGKELMQVLEKENVWGSNMTCMDIDAVDVYAYAGRLLVTVEIEIAIKNTDGSRIMETKQIMLSCPQEDIKKLTYEREVIEWCCNHTYQNKFEHEDTQNNAGVEYESNIFAGFGDNVYLAYTDKDDKKVHLIRYNVETKKRVEVQEKELVWQAFCKRGRFSDFDS